jgi:hypothetical protein
LGPFGQVVHINKNKQRLGITRRISCPFQTSSDSKQEANFEKFRMTNHKVKFLGDYVIQDVFKASVVSEVLGMSTIYAQISNMTSLALEMDAHGSETITVVSCMNSVFDDILSTVSGNEKGGSFDRLRMIFETYLTKDHDIYFCMPLGRSSSRITKIYMEATSRLQVITHSLYL